MNGRVKLAAAVAVVSVAVAATVAVAGGGNNIREQLSGYEEAPLALSTPGQGEFEARLDKTSISYRLSYRDLEAPVNQAHIHFGAEGQTGPNISVFLCTNLGNGPVGTPTGVPGAAGNDHWDDRSRRRDRPSRVRGSTRVSSTSSSMRFGRARRTRTSTPISTRGVRSERSSSAATIANAEDCPAARLSRGVPSQPALTASASASTRSSTATGITSSSDALMSRSMQLAEPAT